MSDSVDRLNANLSKWRREDENRRKGQRNFALGFGAALVAGSYYMAAQQRRQDAIAAAQAAGYRAKENYSNTWVNNSVEGKAYAQWEPGAQRLLSQTDARDQHWFQTWDAVTGYFRDQVPADEAARFHRAINPPEQNSLIWAVVGAFAAAALAAVWFVMGLVGPTPMVYIEYQDGLVTRGGELTYEHCLEAVERDDVDFITSKSQCASGDPVRRNLIRGGATAALLATGVGLLLFRNSRAKSARAMEEQNAQVALSEQRDRVDHFGYDPLTLRPGQAPFYWTQEDGFADRIDAIGATYELRFDMPTHLPPTHEPQLVALDSRYPVEIQQLLAQMGATGRD